MILLLSPSRPRAFPRFVVPSCRASSCALWFLSVASRGSAEWRGGAMREALAPFEAFALMHVRVMGFKSSL